MLPSPVLKRNMAGIWQRGAQGRLTPREYPLNKPLNTDTEPEDLFNSGGAGLFGSVKEFSSTTSSLINPITFVCKYNLLTFLGQRSSRCYSTTEDPQRQAARFSTQKPLKKCSPTRSLTSPTLLVELFQPSNLTLRTQRRDSTRSASLYPKDGA